MNPHELPGLTPLGRQHLIGRLVRGARVAAVARDVGLCTTTVWRWWRRWQQAGATGLENRSSRRHRSPQALPRWPRRQVVRLRQQRRSSVQIAEQLRLPRSTVVHVQRRLELATLPPAVPRPPVVRDERRVPGGLIHLDIKKLGRIGRVRHRIHGDRRTRVRGIRWEYLHIAIGDATRLAFAALLPDETAASMAAFLAQARRWFAHQGIR